MKRRTVKNSKRVFTPDKLLNTLIHVSNVSLLLGTVNDYPCGGTTSIFTEMTIIQYVQ